MLLPATESMTGKPESKILVSPVRPGAQGPVDREGKKIAVPLHEAIAETTPRTYSGLTEEDDIPGLRAIRDIRGLTPNRGHVFPGGGAVVNREDGAARVVIYNRR